MTEMERLNAALKAALYLEPEDIAANQNGVITERQITRIKGQLRAAWAGIGCIGLLVVVPTIAMVVVFHHFILEAVIVLFAVLQLRRFMRGVRQIRHQHQIVRSDLAAGKAERIEGVLLKEKRSKPETAYFKIVDLSFVVPKRVYEAANAGQQVGVYYLPESREFLSIAYAGAPSAIGTEPEEITL
jgi:hypothetical protein